MHCAMNTTRGIICSNGNGNDLGRSQEQMMRYIWRFENDPHPVWMSHSLRFIWILCEVCFCSTFLSFHLVDALFFSAAEASQKNGTAIEEMDGCVRFTKRHSNTSGIRNFVLWRLEWARTLNYGRHTQRWPVHSLTHTHTQPRTYCIAALPRFPIAPHGSCLPFRNWPSAESNICARMLQMPFRYDAMAMWNRKFVGGALFNNTFTHGDASKYSHRHRRERARAARSLPYWTCSRSVFRLLIPSSCTLRRNSIMNIHRVHCRQRWCPHIPHTSPCRTRHLKHKFSLFFSVFFFLFHLLYFVSFTSISTHSTHPFLNLLCHSFISSPFSRSLPFSPVFGLLLTALLPLVMCLKKILHKLKTCSTFLLSWSFLVNFIAGEMRRMANGNKN